jgi:hypothetical protein
MIDGTTLRITLVAPPQGVSFGLQKGKSEIVCVTRSTGKDQAFEVPVRIKEGRDGAPDFTGPFVQGPPGGRFIYITSGKRAGDQSDWDRRAKVPLNGITWELIHQVEQFPNASIAVTIPGNAKDGGPICAGIKLQPQDWRLD